MPDAPEPDDDALVVHVAHEVGDARAAVTVRGDVDTFSVGELSAALEKVMTDGAIDLHLDLSGVRFMDSTGISALITARTQLEGRGGVVVDDASPSVRRVFEVAGLHVFFGTA